MTKKEIKEALMKELDLCVKITNDWWSKQFIDRENGDEDGAQACRRLAKEARNDACHTLWVMSDVFKVISQEEHDALLDKVIDETCNY